MLSDDKLKQRRVLSGDSSSDIQQEPASVQDHHPHCKGLEERSVANWEWVEAGGRARLSLPSVGRAACQRGSAHSQGWTRMGKVYHGRSWSPKGRKVRGGNGPDSSACDSPGQTSKREVDHVEAPTSGESGFDFNFDGNPRKFLAGETGLANIS